MRMQVPILFTSSQTPPPREGLILALSETCGTQGTWIHGSLALPAEDDPTFEELLPEVFLVAITEANQLGAVACLLGQRSLLTPPSGTRAAVDGDGGELLRVAFSLHSSRLVGPTLIRDRHYLHAALGDRLSAAHHLDVVEAPPPHEFGGDAPGDRLLRAYDHALAKRWPEALVAFEDALVTPEVAADLDGAHLYNAACAAAVCLAEGAEAHLAIRAVAWLRRDLELRCAAHTRRSLELAVRPEAAADLQQVDMLFRDYVHDLHRGPALALLRGTPAWQALRPRPPDRGSQP